VKLENTVIPIEAETTTLQPLAGSVTKLAATAATLNEPYEHQMNIDPPLDTVATSRQVYLL